MSGAASTPGDLPSVFTQCSKCETVFRLSAEVLRAAGGQVRCGKCGEVFNALAHLAEDASAFTHGESSFDSETRADNILGSPAPPSPRAPPSEEDFAPPGVEIARLQILDWDEHDESELPAAESDDPAAEQLGETSLEFTLPPGELDRIFVETKRGGVRPRMPPAQPQDGAEPEEIEVFNAAQANAAVPIGPIPKSAASVAASPAPAPTSPAAPSGFGGADEVRLV